MIRHITMFLSVFFVLYLSATSSSQAKTPHGIIMISLDTLRADHLGVYGYHRNTSPSIDDFSRESIVFENAVVQSPWTLPSHMSMVTSLYPSFHGLLKRDSPPLANQHKTLAELLQERGYQTAAFTGGAWVNPVYGFGRGFDTYDNQGGGIAVILPKVKKWLDENKSKPFFLFMHCFDIHSPYNPPPPYNSIFHDFTYTGRLVPNTKNLAAAIENDLAIDNEDLRHFIALYDGGIRYTDEKIGDLLSYLREAQLYDQTLTMITSDHGEEFKEHGSMGHWQLYYRPNLHVPLIIHIPGYPKKEIRVNELVRSIDLLPTVLDIAGCPPYTQAQGRSLLPSIKRKKNFFNHFLWRIVKPFAKDVHFSFAEDVSRDGKTSYWAVTTSDAYQMLFNSQSPSINLFNLRADPLAKENIAQNNDDRVERLFSQWEKLYTGKSAHSSSDVKLDNQTFAQLKALGYLETPEQMPLELLAASLGDPDKDGVKGFWDNCPHRANPGQEDVDKDEKGDMCDNCTDTDWDGYGNPGFSNVCVEDNCPYTFNPGQEDEDGDGIGDICEPSWRENHWIEAEYPDSIVDPLEVTDDEGASQGGYMHSPHGTGTLPTPDGTMAVYTVHISQAGEYVLWGRVSTPNRRRNSFFVQMDNGMNNLWDVKPGDFWHWDAVNNRKKADPVTFTLAEGMHTINVKLRTRGTKLDKLLLTNIIGFVPGGMGERAEHGPELSTSD